MRIIAGVYKSRILKAPAGFKTRPTSDRLRETLFNVLAPRMEGARFIDLYAGTGAVGLEALSRGAAEVCFVETAAAAAKFIRANITALGLDNNRALSIEIADVASCLRKAAAAGRTFDLIFLDPPYDEMKEYDLTLRALPSVMATNALVIAEHRKKDKLADEYGQLHRTRLLEQGDAALSFYQMRLAEG
jgi:16S rRNA (guanine(966)-N(2))-methyltransferase RsmD